MRRNKLVGLVFSLLCLQLSGCTSSLFLDATLPPAVSVHHDQWKVLVVNRYDASLLPYRKDRKVEVFKEGANQAVAGAMRAIFDDSTFVLVHADSAVQLPSSPQAPELNPDEIKALYTQYPSHLILTLDSFDASLDKEVETVADGNGEKSKTAHYTLFVSTKWTLYDSSGFVLDRAALKLDEYYNSRGVISGLLAIGPAMANAGPVVNKLALESGFSYWDRLYPQKSVLERQVHATAPFAIPLGHFYTQQWEQAIDALLPLASDSGFKHRAKAAHNLAVAYEATGNYEQATYWAKMAANKGDKLAKLLLQEWERTGRNKSPQAVKAGF